MGEGMNRRRFLTVLGVTGGGAAAVGACGVGAESTKKLIPYLVQPEDEVPGTATMFATTCRECAAGCGVHAKVREGRVIKLEGNPESPVNRGRLCARGQAALQGVYNPDRVTEPLARNAQGVLEKVTWEVALGHLSAKVKAARGKGIVFVTGHEAGSFGDLVDEWVQTVGGKHVTYEPFGFEALREGNRLAFGTDAVPSYDLANAKYILSFGADFLDTWLSPVGYQGAFAQSHGFHGEHDGGMAKFVFVGPRMSLTAMNADEWIAPAPGTEGLLALALAQVIVHERLGAAVEIGRVSELLGRHTPQAVAGAVGIDAAAIEHLAREFAKAKTGVALAGGMAAHYPNGAEIVAAVNILNYVVGAVGKTVVFGPNQSLDTVSPFKRMADVVTDMQGGKVALLLVHGANPGHSLGGGFWQAWAKVDYKVSFSSYLDETASAADLILPDLHPLEQWNDSRPRAGVFALQQPVMQQVFPNTRQTGDVLLSLAGKVRHVQGLPAGAVEGGPRAARAGQGLRGLLERCVAARRRVRRRAGSVGPPRRRCGPYHGGRARRARVRGQDRRSRAGRVPVDGAARRARSQQVVASGAARSGLEDRLARLGRGASRHCRQVVGHRRRFPDAAITPWIGARARRGHPGHPSRRDRRSHRAGAYGLRPLRAGPIVQRVRSALGRCERLRRPHLHRPGVDPATGEHRFLATSSGDPRGFGGGEDIVKVLPVAEAVKLHPGESHFQHRGSSSSTRSTPWRVGRRRSTRRRPSGTTRAIIPAGGWPWTWRSAPGARRA